MEKKTKSITIRESAFNYESLDTKNISELDKVSIDLELREETYKKGTEDEFTVKIATIGEEDYRVPISVLKALKEILTEKPDLEFFKVKKSGEGMKTSYTVIPL